MKKMLNDKARLQHIFDAILEIEEYIKNRTESDFFGNSMLHSACIRQLEIIGEAAGRVSEEIRAESADIPWKEIIGLRNFLIHEYFGVDLDIVRDVIWTDMPKLKKEVKALLDAMSE
jgi:uncharacterized protein with HEPN domain